MCYKSGVHVGAAFNGGTNTFADVVMSARFKWDGIEMQTRPPHGNSVFILFIASKQYSLIFKNQQQHFRATFCDKIVYGTG